MGSEPARAPALHPRVASSARSRTPSPVLVYFPETRDQLLLPEVALEGGLAKAGQTVFATPHVSIFDALFNKDPPRTGSSRSCAQAWCTSWVETPAGDDGAHSVGAAAQTTQRGSLGIGRLYPKARRQAWKKLVREAEAALRQR
mmetsp:Transcript_11572/g.33068  ORF Transcript_11572/g.33068 Transcript_11572/m.33068 type:complete len:144 (+) Transcript_11572:85-516(+)